MKIINLTDLYIENVIEMNNSIEYEKSFPSLYNHYYHFWTKRIPFQTSITKEWIEQRLNQILSRIEFIETQFNRSSFDTSKVELVLFVGNGSTNGHAFKNGKKFVVWIPIETYSTPLLADVFIAHEIIHLFHYEKSPDYYFNNLSEKQLLSRQLITEGIATYLSMIIMNLDERTALWGDYISKNEVDKWYSLCKSNENELNEFMLTHFSSSDSIIEIFHAIDPNDIYKYRAGYYIGLQLIKQISLNHSIDKNELLKIDVHKFNELAVKQLQSFQSAI